MMRWIPCWVLGVSGCYPWIYADEHRGETAPKKDDIWVSGNSAEGVHSCDLVIDAEVEGLGLTLDCLGPVTLHIEGTNVYGSGVCTFTDGLNGEIELEFAGDLELELFSLSGRASLLWDGGAEGSGGTQDFDWWGSASPDVEGFFTGTYVYTDADMGDINVYLEGSFQSN